jgi:hypothetical protein
MADGRVNKCKVCNRRDVQRNRQNKREYYCIYDSKREKSVDRIEQKKRRNNKRRLLYPEKYKANYLIKNMIRDGKLERKSCYLCGEPKTEAHHPDYSKPKFVVWLCSACHHAIHAPELMYPRLNRGMKRVF